MILECATPQNVIRIVASNPIGVACKFNKVVIRKITLRGEEVFQAASYTATQVFHENVCSAKLSEWVENNIFDVYKQILVETASANVTYLLSKNGKRTRICKAADNRASGKSQLNDRKKKYLINEGDKVEALVDLGIFTTEYKVVKTMYDKFKQVNRFLEILDDVFKDYSAKKLTMLDFGAGKAYLTFIVYYYFAVIKGIDVEIIGYDLKADVVQNCNLLARKYGYDNLSFVVADVTKDVLTEKSIDAVLSLHACDTATDYALHYAVTHKVKYVFSVPCCQHEINACITSGGDLDVMLKYGIIKDRLSSLLTDSVRATVLEDCGYKVDILEFVDFAHTPKNLMLRAVRTGKATFKNKDSVLELLNKYNATQKLASLIYKE